MTKRLRLGPSGLRSADVPALRRTPSKAWQTFKLWLHPDAGWRTAAAAPVSLADFVALLDTPASGAEPRLRVRGDLVRMTEALQQELGAGATVEDDFTELRWLRVLAPQAPAARVAASLAVPSDGVVATAAPGAREQLTVRLQVTKSRADVSYTVRSTASWSTPQHGRLETPTYSVLPKLCLASCA